MLPASVGGLVTRSVEIPDEAVEAVAKALNPILWEEDGLLPPVLVNSGRWQKRHEVRAALEAALPHLVPADMCHNGHPFEPGEDLDMEHEGRSPSPHWCNVCGEARHAGDDNAYHYSSEEIAAKVADRVPHADMDGFTLSERLRIGKAVAPLFREMLPPVAPAGDGGLRDASAEPKLSNPDGLREALEQACKIAEVRGRLKVPVTGLRALLAAHPAAHAVPTDTAESTASTSAVPQPVDREALEKLLEDFGGECFYESGVDQTSVRKTADAVLAVLAGEQEQVEK